MARLDQIVHEMESSKLDLEDLLKRYEEGTKLIEACHGHLDAAEVRIETLTRGTNSKAPEQTNERPKDHHQNPGHETSLF